MNQLRMEFSWGIVHDLRNLEFHSDLNRYMIIEKSDLTIPQFPPKILQGFLHG